MNPFGLSTKLALIFGFLLLVSLGGNIELARRMWMQQQKDVDAAQLAKTAAERDGLKLSARVNGAIAEQKGLDTTALLADLHGIAEAARPVRVVYRSAAHATPLAANCAPGAPRVGAVNDYLGPRNPAPAVKPEGGSR